MVLENIPAGNGSQHCGQQYWHEIHTIVVKQGNTWNLFHRWSWFSNNLRLTIRNCYVEVQNSQELTDQIQVTSTYKCNWVPNTRINTLRWGWNLRGMYTPYCEQCRIHWIAGLPPKENLWDFRIVPPEQKEVLPITALKLHHVCILLWKIQRQQKLVPWHCPQLQLPIVLLVLRHHSYPSEQADNYRISNA